jgi:hypothetical protein
MKNKKILKMMKEAGSFAENKDVARSLRENFVFPNLKNNIDIVFDYNGVSTTTQSFTHALISQAIREFGADVLDRITFKNCNEDVKKIINIVAEYMQGNMESPVS